MKAVVGKNQQVVGSSPSAGSIQVKAQSCVVGLMGLEVFEVAQYVAQYIDWCAH